MKGRVKRLVTLAQMRRAMFPSDAEIEDQLMPRLGVKHRKQSARVFATQGAAGGRVWRPLTPRYKRWKEIRKPGRKILAFTGDMRRSFTSAKHKDYIERFRNGAVELGSSNLKAGYHENEAHDDPRSVLRRTDIQRGEMRQVVNEYMIPRFLRFISVLRAIGRAA